VGISGRAAQHGLWIVLPLSGIARGKSRLASVLSPAGRTRLNRQLAQHGVRAVVDSLQDPTHCVVVSPCARSLRVARDAGVSALAEGRPARGLNAAVRQAVGYALRRGARRVLVLHADLPRLSESSLRELLRRADPAARSVIVPDRERIGTNALLCPAGPGIVLHFGAESFAKHCETARAAGRAPSVVEIDALMQDLDTPEHHAAWLAAGRRWGR